MKTLDSTLVFDSFSYAYTRFLYLQIMVYCTLTVSNLRCRDIPARKVNQKQILMCLQTYHPHKQASLEKSTSKQCSYLYFMMHESTINRQNSLKTHLLKQECRKCLPSYILDNSLTIVFLFILIEQQNDYEATTRSPYLHSLKRDCTS